MSHDDSHTCACGGNCGCQSSEQADTDTVYLTREQYVARLEQYLLELKAEIVAVENELQKLKSPEELVAA